MYSVDLFWFLTPSCIVVCCSDSNPDTGIRQCRPTRPSSSTEVRIQSDVDDSTTLQTFDDDRKSPNNEKQSSELNADDADVKVKLEHFDPETDSDVCGKKPIVILKASQNCPDEGIAQRMFTETTPFVSKADVCTDEVGSSSSPSSFHCGACGQVFASEAELCTHCESLGCLGCDRTSMTISRCITRLHLCDTCGKHFASALSLRNHSRLHTGVRPFSCSTWGRSFVQKVALVHHQHQHLGIKPYQCNFCKRSFAQKGQLTVHTRQHTGERPFACDICLMGFVSKTNLTNHRKLHTGERPHTCMVCGKNFAYKESLVVHTRTHTGEKPFACNICGKKYTQAHHLKGHLRTHTGEKPFQCHLCEKSYKNRVDLRFHCTKIHDVDITKRHVGISKHQDKLLIVSPTQTNS